LSVKKRTYFMYPVELPSKIKKLFPYENHFTEINGRRVHYIDEGEGDPVILLHGNPTWSFLYRNIIPLIKDRCRVVAPDYIGFGLSEKPAEESAYTLEGYIANLKGLIDYLKLRNITLVCQDWGGPIGLGYAVKHRDNVRGLVLLNTWAFTDPSSFHKKILHWRMLHAPIAGQITIVRMNVMVEANLRSGTYHRERLTQEAMDAYRFPFIEPSSRIGILAFPRMIPLKPNDAAYNTMAEIEKSLPKLDVPTKIVWGATDPVFPQDFAEKFHRLLPEAEEPLLIEDGCHFIQEDAPEKISEKILELLES